MLKRTALYEEHQKLGARLVEFGGWEMPVQYTSISDEHQAVRNKGGIFDIAHMGEVWVQGAAAQEFLNYVLTNDIRKLTPGNGQYTLMPNERGGVVDDLYAYQIAPQKYLLIINASRIEEDVGWLQARLAEFHEKSDVTLTNASNELGAIALQGPISASIIDQIPDGGSKPSALLKNQILEAQFAGETIWVGRTGYTGEDGFEIVAPNKSLAGLWNKLLAAGRAQGLQPAGLGARDTLRTEMCYPLYGHELDENTSPIEAGVGFFVALEKGPFIGRDVMAKQKAEGPTRKCIAFKLASQSAPPRPGYPVLFEGKPVGKVASGTQSPSLGAGIGMAFVPAEIAKAGTPIAIEVRGRQYAAVISSKPLYRKVG